jgi:hypothetical protein
LNIFATEQSKTVKNKAFGKTKRFESDETEVPGPGQYKSPDSCVVREGTREMAAYKSAVIREFVKESSSPAVG